MIYKNGLLVAPMQTASTSIEPHTSDICCRVLSGELVLVNKNLLHDLTEMGLWTATIKDQIIYEDGSVQKIVGIPEDLKALYKTVCKMKQRTMVDMAVDRGCHIDQSKNLNIHIDQPNFGKLTSLHLHTWSEKCRKVVVSDVHGACIGGGIDIITACDVGITADLGTLQRLPGIVGHGNAMELVLTGRVFGAEEAKGMDQGVHAIAQGPNYWRPR